MNWKDNTEGKALALQVAMTAKPWFESPHNRSSPEHSQASLLSKARKTPDHHYMCVAKTQNKKGKEKNSTESQND